MASSLKAVLRKKAGQDGMYPLAIRLTIDRKSSYIYLGQYLKASDWDAIGQKVRKSHPNSTRLNHYILQKKAELNEKLLEMTSQHKEVSSQKVRRQVDSKGGASFFNQAAVFVENLRKQGKYNRVSTEQPRINRFRES